MSQGGSWEAWGEKEPLTPLAYLQAVYSDESLPIETRLEAAIAALPYSHARETAASSSQDSEPRPYQVNIVRFSDLDPETQEQMSSGDASYRRRAAPD